MLSTERRETRQKLRKLQDLLCKPYSSIHASRMSEDIEYGQFKYELSQDKVIGKEINELLGDYPDLDDWIAHRERLFGYNLEGEINTRFNKLLEHLSNEIPSSETISERFNTVSTVRIREFWTKSVSRLGSEPEAAITLARSMLETVCKSILTERQIVFDDKGDLVGLYKLVAKNLDLEASDAKSAEFTRLAGGCSTIIQAIARIRNELGDAHGKSLSGPIPDKEHAQFVVTIAGSTALFLWERHIRTHS